MMRSLYSGVSGLKNHQTRMDVVGNNISNVNTTGFKSSRVTFADTLSQTLTGASGAQGNRGGTNPKQIGLGSALSSVDLLFTDGSVQSTGVNTDLCLSGNGLFVVRDGGGSEYYTRNGNFKFDEDGNFVNTDGYFVMGYTADANGNINAAGDPGKIFISSNATMKATQTTTVAYKNNLQGAQQGSTVESLLITYEDGSVESGVKNYNPEKAEAITLTLEDATGNTVQKKVDSGSYDVGGNYDFTSKIKSITGTELELDYDLEKSGYKAVGGDSIQKVSGTYAVGDKYTATKTIKSVTADKDNDQIVIAFNEDSDGITSVTVPTPEGKTYKIGDVFNLSLVVKGGRNSDSYVNEDGFEVKDKGELGKDSTVNAKVTAAANNPDGYKYNNKVVKSATAVLADGTTGAALVGTTYKSGDAYYPTISTTFTAYDSQGGSHSIPVLFTKTSANTWKLSTAGGGNTTSIVDGNTIVTVNLSSEDLVFDGTGMYVSGSATIDLSYTTQGEDGQPDPATIMLTLSGLTQYAGSSTVAATANGNAEGTLKSISVDSAGIITGTYTNGINKQEAQVAVAKFSNASGLTKNGGSLYTKSNNSGDPQYGAANALGCKITPSALEMSNVDLANELSDMIVTQRGFQSNSKIITVSDEMIETLVNMKR